MFFCLSLFRKQDTHLIGKMKEGEKKLVFLSQKNDGLFLITLKTSESRIRCVHKLFFSPSPFLILLSVSVRPITTALSSKLLSSLFSLDG